MPFYCCVPKCTNKKGGHRFPLKNDLRKQWILAIRRNKPGTRKPWEPNKNSVVCSDHFTDGDYVQTLLGEKKRLSPNAVPSVFSFKPTRTDHARQQRLARRNELAAAQASVVSEDHVNEEHAASEIGAEVLIEEPVEESLILPVPTPCTLESREKTDAAVNCTLLENKVNFSVELFRQRPDIIKYYTGLNCHAHFMLLFSILGNCVYHLGIHCHLHAQDQLFLTLIKLRQAKEDFELSLLFDIRQNTVSHITHVWIRFLYFQLKEAMPCPPQDVVREFMPQDFKAQFPSTRMIVDGTEIPIQKPSKVEAQCATFSTYKNRNTLKVLVGCSPRGVVSYVSPAYGGSTSDRQICERSELLTNPELVTQGDSIMADRGFNVQDLFASKDIKINIPTFLKGKSQLSASAVIKDRRIASKRIHVERMIGLAKTFKILKKEVAAQRVVLGDYIISVCFYLTNFKNCIMTKYM